DGVRESQFVQVINIELDKIIEFVSNSCTHTTLSLLNNLVRSIAHLFNQCRHANFWFLGEKWSPKFTVIVAQKNHHTNFFQAHQSPDNVPPGDKKANTLPSLQETR
ncbi:hypothetical protein U9M48_045077, partial [Paspalum notatum var. saurae]